MEKDKSILTLAVVGIGYLATFANLGDKQLIGLELILFGIYPFNLKMQASISENYP
ncbi:hypothetical protein ABMY18_23440 [Vibrio vulnificus]|uniref:hypothetical protein n=1 Tax=Vibrio vulnificus TaxID=672 RepID=UPI003ED9594A